jgi:hypothetical protein
MDLKYIFTPKLIKNQMEKNITNVVILLFEVNGFNIYIYLKWLNHKNGFKIYIIP